MNKCLHALPLLSVLTFAQVKTIPSFDAAALDRKADPCVDFYRFACGGWMAANPIPPEQSRWGRFDELQERNRDKLREILEKTANKSGTRTTVEQEIGDYYAACMDEKSAEAKGFAPLKPTLDRIASLPSKAAITAELLQLNETGVQPFFSIGSNPDFKQSTSMIANVDQGGMGLPDRDYYLKTDAKSVQLQQQYIEHVTRMLNLLGEAPDAAAKRARTVMRIETTLAKAALDRVARRDPNRVYHKYTVAELISLAPGIDWQKYFEGIGLGGLQTLNVAEPNFTRAIEAVVVQNSLDDLKTYLTWQVLNAHASFLSRPFVDENFDFFGRILTGAKQLRLRWNRCVIYADDQLGDALGQKFVEKTFGAEGKERTLAMVHHLEAALGRDIEDLDWMSPETKKQALIKLHAIVNKIGYPEKWRDYSSVNVVRDDLAGNVDRLNKYEFHRVMNKVGKPVDRTEWGMSPPTVNAYYNPTMNDINFPAGILQPPFFDKRLDDALNYGAIGSVIGHELTHGFDDEGRQFDAQGNLRDWWTPEDAKRFEERSECLVQEYGNFTAVEDVKLNGKLTLGENTADNGGVRIARMALLQALGGRKPSRIDGFTGEQRFFLGWAQIWCQNVTEEAARLRAAVDPHSPGRYRVNGTLMNMPEFGKAFACRTGTPMTSGPACRAW
jgi:putative endopeptidase